MDWGRISDDYLKYRAGPPTSYYSRLREQGVGLPGQRLLDFGTGTGVLARMFAKAGARVAGVDPAAGQIEKAKKAAAEERVKIDFRVAPAESTPFPDHSFDAITANQCWHFVDDAKALREAKRLLVPGGILVVSDFFWLATKDRIAAATEDLVLKYSPGWTGYRWAGEMPARPDLPMTAVIAFEEFIPFTRESWAGRVRTCRAIGPSLSPETVAAFDRDHIALLKRIAPEEFMILHKVLAHLYRMA